MTENKIPSFSSEDHKDLIVGVRLEKNSPWVTLQCHKCGHCFERRLTDVAGIVIGRYSCPRCGEVLDVLPDDYLAAFELLLPPLTDQERYRLMEEVNRITENWYLHPLLAACLEYRGINLGRGAEIELFPLVCQGLYPTQE
jgi:hypothetical protein